VDARRQVARDAQPAEESAVVPIKRLEMQMPGEVADIFSSAREFSNPLADSRFSQCLARSANAVMPRSHQSELLATVLRGITPVAKIQSQTPNES
jgi:hypothetical protein